MDGEGKIVQVSNNKCFEGFQKVYSHTSKELGCDMKFAVYLPPAVVKGGKAPVLYWLSGLTCTEQNFITKSGYQKYASEMNLIVVAPDTSPRGCNIDGENDSWDLGTGAGFYVDATEEKWRNNYRMYSYVTKELPQIINSNFPTVPKKMSISGHSMGGHGALICFLKNPGMYQSVSAFAPICNPSQSPWGTKALLAYLGANKETWKEYDATELVREYKGAKGKLLIHQGMSDEFFEKELFLDNLVKACQESGTLDAEDHRLEGYDHSYYFISSFIEEHIRHHAAFLNH